MAESIIIIIALVVATKDLGSVLEEKLIFENNDFRTIKWTKAIQRITATSKALQENKNGTSQFFIEKSHQVARTRFELVSPP